MCFRFGLVPNRVARNSGSIWNKLNDSGFWHFWKNVVLSFVVTLAKHIPIFDSHWYTQTETSDVIKAKNFKAKGKPKAFIYAART